MNREEARKAAEVMIAYADGEEIEFSGNDKDWELCILTYDVYPNFDWHMFKYRIKPKPLECWALIRGDGEIEGYFNALDVDRVNVQHGEKLIYMREVTQ